jgi:hypothetical protein
MLMGSLSRELRRSLENTVRAARRAAETGAHKAIEQLAVHHHEPWPSMTPVQRELRNRLRAHGRQLGDRRDERRGMQAINHLTTECAYEHWHRMLFARFLAETELLIEPRSGVAISLAECHELARDGGRDWLELAAEFAQRMLPQIFRSGDPVLEVALPPETRSALEDLMKALPGEVFLADDSLGWVYQYWQVDLKEAINRSEKKIGAEELPAVTQLFTEDYMVLFLLHNTLGAWWAGKVLADNPGLAQMAVSEEELRFACALGGVEWTYLRFVREGDQPWRPAAGTFEGWPKAAKDITLLDPCMGSGHFLVFALPILAALRAQQEGIAPTTAISAVLSDNLYGLEIDARCTQIAAFNLALAAWRRVGYRTLPTLHLACSGLSLGVTKPEWIRLAERAATALPIPPKTDLFGTEHNLFSDAMKRGFERLYDLFTRAPWLGSLIDPRAAGGDLVEYGFGDLEPILVQVMVKADNAEMAEMAVAAQGLAKASEILAKGFTLVATNVPYLGRGKQDEVLKEYCGRMHGDAKADLATCFVERCLSFCTVGGSAVLVTPQNWLFLGTYKRLRGRLLEHHSWDLIVRLGANAFQDMNWWAATTALVQISKVTPTEDHFVKGIDVSEVKEQDAKALLLQGKGERNPDVQISLQTTIRKKPDARITFDEPSTLPLLSAFADAYQGTTTGDNARYLVLFWELSSIGDSWIPFQAASEFHTDFSAREFVLRWEDGRGELARSPEARVQGQGAFNRAGVVVGQMRELPVTRYTGEFFSMNGAAVVPRDPMHLGPIWCFCSSEAYRTEIRKIDSALKVTNASLVKIPFDLAHWRQVVAVKYPAGLPEPYSDNPTQWLFKGHPKGSDAALQVAVARLVGYLWPPQTGSSFPDCAALGQDELEKHANRGGIVTLSPVKGEPPAAVKLISLLADAFGSEWSAAKLNSMLAQTGCAGKTLDDWLRDVFFEQHCALFHQRPFVWHVWDGRRDGFHALVNYHRIAGPDGEGRRTLERILYTLERYPKLVRSCSPKIAPPLE